MNNLISKKSCPFHLHDQLFVILVFVLLLILNAANREFFVYLFCLFSQNESNVNKSQKADKLLVMFFFTVLVTVGFTVHLLLISRF